MQVFSIAQKAQTASSKLLLSGERDILFALLQSPHPGFGALDFHILRRCSFFFLTTPINIATPVSSQGSTAERRTRVRWALVLRSANDSEPIIIGMFLKKTSKVIAA
jgi:hypothetical protein